MSIYNSIITIDRKHSSLNKKYQKIFSKECAEQVQNFHKSIPGYEPTPLAVLNDLATALNVQGIYVKDESKRFGLNAFKALGGSYAIGSYLAQCLGRPISELPYTVMTSEQVRQTIGNVTFVTATDGNHGRGVAWTAHCLGQKSVIYMPKGTATERLENICKLGADASILDLGYDDCVRKAKADSEKNGWILVQDTSFPGYDEIPVWIMQGYMTMAYEALQQLGEIIPTHVFLQAGVGSMAGAVAAFLASYYGEKCPKIIVVEPHTADCFALTAKANDGTLHAVTGEMRTMMAGLACGEVNPIAWDILGSLACSFVSMPDIVAADGMRCLAHPINADPVVISGESGASAFGYVLDVLQKEELAEIKTTLGLHSDSVVLCFSTEGDTDQENYRKIVDEHYENA